jgi:hypothetical protein
VITDEKLQKFLKRLDKMVFDLARNQRLPVHSNINQFYYMQKSEELKILKDRFDEELKKLMLAQEDLESLYKQVFTRWSKDVRILRSHLISSKESIL